jgi:molybdate transport system substrate-binding protein
MVPRLSLLVALCLLPMTDARAAEEPRVLAAGSLRQVMAEIGEHYKQATGTTVTAEFGPSGLLRERIEKGDHADLLASADMGHPLKLLQEGRATRVVMFTRNTLYGIAAPQVGLTTANFLDRLLDPAVKLGTSTPKADPAGDLYMDHVPSRRCSAPGELRDPQRQGAADRRWPLEQRPGRRQGSRSRRTRLGPSRHRHRLLYKRQAEAVADGRAAGRGGPTRDCHRAEYGLAVLKGADPRASDLALFMLSPDGQQIFAHYGFAPIALPAPER